TRNRGGVIRIRVRETRKRAETRKAARQHPSQCLSGRRQGSTIILVAPVCSRAGTRSICRHDFSGLSEYYFFDIVIYPGLQPYLCVSGIIRIAEYKAISHIHLTFSAIGIGLYADINTVSPFPYMAEDVFYASIRWHFDNSRYRPADHL